MRAKWMMAVLGVMLGCGTAMTQAREARFAWEPITGDVDGYSIWVQPDADPETGGENPWIELVQVTGFDPEAATIEITHACPDGGFRTHVTGWVNLENEEGVYGRYHSAPSFTITVPGPFSGPASPKVIPLPAPLSWQSPQDEEGESRRIALQYSSDLESWQMLADGRAALKPQAFFRLVLY